MEKSEATQQQQQQKCKARIVKVGQDTHTLCMKCFWQHPPVPLSQKKKTENPKSGRARSKERCGLYCNNQLYVIVINFVDRKAGIVKNCIKM